MLIQENLSIEEKLKILTDALGMMSPVHPAEWKGRGRTVASEAKVKPDFATALLPTADAFLS